jgi:hypothetical protein
MIYKFFASRIYSATRIVRRPYFEKKVFEICGANYIVGGRNADDSNYSPDVSSSFFNLLNRESKMEYWLSIS